MTNTADHNSLKLMIVGEGGQGVQTVAKIITRAAFAEKLHSSYIPNFGTEQRGGLSLSFVQVSKAPIISPKFKTADLFIILSDRDVDRVLRYIGKQTHVLYDKNLIEPNYVTRMQAKSNEVFDVNAFEIATQELTERSFNIVILGILTGLIESDLRKAVVKEMDKKFEKYYKKNAELKEYNQKAFEIGLKMTLDE